MCVINSISSIYISVEVFCQQDIKHLHKTWEILAKKLSGYLFAAELFGDLIGCLEKYLAYAIAQ